MGVGWEMLLAFYDSFPWSGGQQVEHLSLQRKVKKSCVCS